MADSVPALFILEQDIASVQIDLDLDLGAFDGALQVVYNVQDPLNYYYTEFAEGHVRQGYMEHGGSHLMDDQPFVPAGWSRYRIVSDQGHFRVYAGGEGIAHGHSAAPGAGHVGLRISGDGTILLGRLAVLSLR